MIFSAHKEAEKIYFYYMVMEIPKFNPHSPEYKKVEDLPMEERENFKDVKGGFVKKTALENIDEIRSDEEYLLETPENTKINGDLIEKCERLLGIEEVGEIRRIIKSLHAPIKKTIEQALEGIEMGDYQLLISDDASARIPTLIFRKFINEVYSRNNLSPINTIFLAGSTSRVDMRYPDSDVYISDERLHFLKNEKDNKLNNYFEELKDRSSTEIKKAIFVTEYIDTGGGTRVMADALNKNNIHASIFALRYTDEWSTTPEQIIQELKKRFENRSYFIGEFGHWPEVLHNKRINGVKKFFADLYAVPINSSLSGDEKREALAAMTIARDEANNVADKLILELLGQKQ